MTPIVMRPYAPERDFEDACRVWKEAGWLEHGNEAVEKHFLEGSAAWVAELDTRVESLVTIAPGRIRYRQADLPLAAVTGVAVSRVARKQGIAARLTVKALAQAAAEGAQVAGLSMFDQGFYDRLGFGTGVYAHFLTFDPADLRLPNPARPPLRLTRDDWERVHAARLKTLRVHGSCVLYPPGVTRADMEWNKKGFGLGYADEQGELTHFLWAVPESVEHGPYDILWMGYRSGEQLLELLSLIKSWGDQVHSVRMTEPPRLQLQDLLHQPFRARRTRREGTHRVAYRFLAYYQWRMLDVPACIAHMRLSAPVRFNLRLHDPAEAYLAAPDAPWQGAGGRYVLSLGETSRAEPGEDPALPVMEASVGALTRWWLGVRPAASLALTDDLRAPAGLLSALDEALCLPAPHPIWEF